MEITGNNNNNNKTCNAHISTLLGVLVLYLKEQQLWTERLGGSLFLGPPRDGSCPNGLKREKDGVSNQQATLFGDIQPYTFHIQVAAAT